MRYIRYAVLAAIAVVLITISLANRGAVTLNLLPDSIANALGFGRSVELPLFIVIFGGIIAGVLIGFVWEWFREHKHRAEAAANRREKDALAREVRALKSDAQEGAGDDVLAILEDAR